MTCQRCPGTASRSLKNENQNENQNDYQNQPPTRARARARAPEREPERERPFQKSCVHSTEISWFLSPTVPSADKSLMISYSMCPSTVFSFCAAFIRCL